MSQMKAKRVEYVVDRDSTVNYLFYETNILLEINDALFSRKDALPELIDKYSLLIKLCKEYEMPVILGSDAHVAEKIGSNENILSIKQKIGLSDDVVINNNLELLLNYLKV